MIYQLLRNVLLFFFLWPRRSFPRGPPPGKNLEGWLGFTEGFTGFTKFWRVLLGFAGFYGFYWILLAFSGFYWVLRCFTVFYWVLLDFTGFYWLFLGFTGFYWVLLGFTGIEWKSRPRLTHSVDRAGGGTRQERSCSEVRTKRRRPTKSETADGAQDQAAGTARERACGRAVHRLPPTIAATDLIIDSSPSLLFFFLSLSSAPLPFVTRFFIGRFQVDRCYWVSFLVVWLLDFTALYWMTDRFCSGHLPFFPYSGRFLPSSCSFFLAIAWSYRVCTGFRLCWV